MKSYGHLYDRICSFENLLLAARKAQRGKRFRENVGRFNLGLERVLLALQEDLRGQTYRPGKYRELKIFQPKERLISAAPYRDRVVHHALCNVIEPIFDRTFIHDSYACRQGKGTHRAVDRLTGFCRRSRYALQCDVRKYFPSIDHEILLGLIARKIRDRQVLGLIRVILDASNPQEPVPDLFFEGDDPAAALARRRGIPIGNLTSQFFANLYLNGLDHFLKEELGCRHYLRYMDDLVALDNDKGWLHWVKEEFRLYLAGLRLRAHEKKCRVFPV